MLYQMISYQNVSYCETTAEDGTFSVEATVESTSGEVYHLAGSWIPVQPEILTIPEGLEQIACTLTCNDLDYGEETFPASLAFDGSDVYLVGCGFVSYYFNGVIKGTAANNTLTFPQGQFVGAGSTSNYFIYGFDWETFACQDIVFTYDAEQEAYVSKSDIFVNSGTCNTLTDSYYEFISDVVLVPSVPVAIETLETSAAAPAKRFIDGRLQISSLGHNFDAVGRLVK